MRKNIGLIIEVIDRNDILINCIVEIRNLQCAFFFGDLNIFKIAHGIITHVAEQSVLNELFIVVFGLKLFGKSFDDSDYIGSGVDACGCGFSIRETFRNNFILYGDRSDRFTTDVAEGIVVSPVVATLEKQTVGEAIPQAKVYRNRSDGVGKNLLAVRF